MHTFLAQSLTLPGPGGSIDGPLTNPKSQLSAPVFGSTMTIGDILSRALPIIFGFAGIALLLMIVGAGFTFLTSAGDAKKMEAGKNQLTFAIVGFVIIFVAYWAVSLFGSMFGLDIISGSFK